MGLYMPSRRGSGQRRQFRHFDVHFPRPACGRGSGAVACGMFFSISFCQTHKHVSETHHAEINNVLILRIHILDGSFYIRRVKYILPAVLQVYNMSRAVGGDAVQTPCAHSLRQSPASRRCMSQTYKGVVVVCIHARNQRRRSAE